MYYNLITEIVGLIKRYEKESKVANEDVYSFAQWLFENFRSQGKQADIEPEWEGKSKGRSADSIINASLVHLYRYAKTHAKAAIAGTAFSTPDDFIYLISLTSFGSMTKTALIKLNVHEKSAGIQIVNRLISNGLVEQTVIETDKRNRMIHITVRGTQLLSESMANIRQASINVTEPLLYHEKMDLIRLLTKLDNFHKLKNKEELQVSDDKTKRTI